MANPLTELKTDLEILAKPNLGGGGATEQEVLKAVQALFKMLDEIEVIKPVVEALTTAIDTGFNEVAGALKTIASHVKDLGQQTGNAGKLTSQEAAEALTALQNALSTASTLIPAGKSVTTVGGPFLELLSKLLQDVPFEKAAETLEEIAQQLEKIGAAL
jgi:polyhydroxyalkanoate synthesis regulator phasin